MNLEELELQYKKLGEEIERLKSEPKLFNHDLSKNYYIVNYKGGVIRSRGDAEAIDFGSMIRTPELAVKHAKRLRVFNLMHRWAEELNRGWKPDWSNTNQAKFTIAMQAGGKVVVDSYRYFKSGVAYFKTEESTEQVIKLIGEDVIKDAWE